MSDLTRTESSNSLVERDDVCYQTPAVDVYENQDEYLILADLPGVTPDQLDVHLDARELRIEGKLPADEDAPPRAYRRVFQVHEGIDPEKIAAEMTLGVLRLHLPKSAVARTRKIAVRAN